MSIVPSFLSGLLLDVSKYSHFPTSHSRQPVFPAWCITFEMRREKRTIENMVHLGLQIVHLQPFIKYGLGS